MPLLSLNFVFFSKKRGQLISMSLNWRNWQTRGHSQWAFTY